jgi:cobalt-precorrin 5A hydrolase/precorrin-3B C17-methyltransferase
VVALYNPVSSRRREGLKRACAILLRYRPLTTPVVVASRLGRAGSRTEVVTLEKLGDAEVDMLTTLVVGSTATRSYDSGDGSVRVYTPRGYLPP